MRHFLQSRTVEEAVHVGRKAALPDELLDSFPWMMFQAMSTACVVHFGEKTLPEILEMLVERSTPKTDALWRDMVT